MSSYQQVENSAKRLYQTSEQLSINASKVIEKRIAMIARQNPFNNGKEMQEMERMVTEKHVAFFESWQNMMVQSWLAQQHLGQLVLSNWLKLASGQPISLENMFYHVNHETLKIFDKGMQPITHRVSANVRRLG